MGRVAEWFGQDVLRKWERRLRGFWRGEGRVVYSCTTMEHMYRQVFDDARMLAETGPNLQVQARTPGFNMPTFYPDFGTISTARYWGGTIIPPEGERRIYLDPPAGTVDEALALEPKPVDDPDQDAAHGIRLYKQACEQLETENLWYRIVDFQGPLNTAALVLKQDELMVAMYTEPEKVHTFLSRVTDHLVALWDYQVREAGGQVGGGLWPYVWLPGDLGAVMTQDFMPLVSAEVYREFELPYVKRIAEHVGGLFIHCCGDYGRHAPALAELGDRLLGIEFSYPFTRLEELTPHLPARTVYVPYCAMDPRQTDYATPFDFYDDLLARADPNARFWFALCGGGDDQESLLERIAKEVDVTD